MTIYREHKRRLLAVALLSSRAAAFSTFSLRAPVARLSDLPVGRFKSSKPHTQTTLYLAQEPVPSEDAAFTSLLLQATAPATTTAQEADLGFVAVQEATEFTAERELEDPMVVDAESILAVFQNVEAILAVTQQAAEAAEASLPKEVSESIPWIPLPAESSSTVDASALEMAEVSEQISASPIEAPSVRKILTFAIPAIGVWLCGPLLSLIDTSAVGLLSGTAQQAALNPATAVTDYAALLIAFMYTGTTNLVASAQETDRGLEGKPTASRSMITAIQLSGYVGAGLGAILFVFARQLLSGIIGNEGIGPEVFGAAMKYVRIRALGMPAAAIIGSAQAGCLGMQDIRSPLYVLGAAALVNFMGDMLFVGSSHPMFGGAAGAAWATVISQYVAVACFLHWLCNKPRSEPKVLNLTKAILELTGDKDSTGKTRRQNFRDAVASFKPLANKGTNFATKLSSITKQFGKGSSGMQIRPKRKADVLFSTRGLLAGRMRGLDMLKFPKLEDAKQFAPYLVPVTATQVGRVSGYVAMSHVVSSSLGTISMAAQQVVVALFYCLCPIADSLNLTAQSFLPVLFGKPKGKERANALRTTSTNFFKAGGIFGAVMSTAVLAIPLVSKFFTTDPAVCAAVNMVTPLLVGIVSVHGLLCAMEGVLLGQKDLAYLGKMYASYFVVVPYFMLRVKKAALAGQAVNLTSVWTVFLGYQLFRCAAWIGRVMQLQGRTDRAASSLEDATA